LLARDIRKERDANDCSFSHLNLILSLHYFVKCRSRTSLAIYNNEFILDKNLTHASAQKWLSKKRQKRLATIVSQKVTLVTSHSLYYSMCSQCPPPARMQAANVDATRQQQAQQPAFHKVPVV